MMPLRTRIHAVWLLILLFSLALPVTRSSAASDSAGWRLVRSNSDGLLIEVLTPSARVESTADGLLLTVAGLVTRNEPGMLRLPLLLLPIHLPHGAQPALRLLDAATNETALAGSLARTPLPVAAPPVFDPQMPPVAQLRPAPRSGPGFEPTEPAWLLPPQGLRNQTLAVLAVAPFQADEARGLLRHHQRLLVEVRYAADATVAAEPTDVGLFSDLLDKHTINRSQANTPSLLANDSSHIAQVRGPVNLAATASGSLKVLVDRLGIQQISANQLSAAGWNLASIDPQRLQLLRAGVEVPLEVTGQGDSLTLRFRGEPSTSRYQATQVYWLLQGNAPGLRTPAALGPGTPVRWEENRFYSSQHTSGGRDGWFAHDLKLVDGPERTMTATLTLPVAVDAGTRLVVQLQGYTPTTHTVEVEVAGQQVGQLVWRDTAATLVPGQTRPFTGTLQLPMALPAGSLEVRLSLPLGSLVDGLMVDWLSLPDVVVPEPQTPFTPQVFADTPSALASGGGSYLIVSHQSFLAALQPLVALHTAQGYQVRLVDVQDIYDEFSYGETDPEAIRALVSYAVRNWRPAPTHLLLVGDGTSDFRDYLAKGQYTFVPPYLTVIDPWLGEIACDTCFARVSGPNSAVVADPRNDLLPDLLVGRLPVQTPEQAQLVVNKIVGYTTAPTGSWQLQNLFLLDDSINENGIPDPAGDFSLSAAYGIGLLPPGALAQSFAYDPSPLAPGSQRPASALADTAKLRERFFAAFDSGAATVTYLGHSGIWQWGATALDAQPNYLWSVYDVDARTNSGRLPIVLSMTCLTGVFQEPTQPELGTTDERLLRLDRNPKRADVGAIATFSASGLGVAHGHDFLYKGLINGLYGPNPATRSLGAAQLNGFLTLLSDTTCCRDMLYTYQIFGDPATMLPLVPNGGARLPFVQR